MNYLGIDYGERRVGIAVASSDFGIAFARRAIDQKAENLMERLAELLKAERIDAFVVGMPNRPDGRRDGKNVVVERFVRELAEAFPGVKIFTQDEAYSSVQAQEKTAYLSKKRKMKEKGIIDSEAAAIILQRFLDGE